MYFSYVPSIKFSFFNRPLFLNLLFNRFIIIIVMIMIIIMIIMMMMMMIIIIHL